MSYYSGKLHAYGIREVLVESGVEIQRETDTRITYKCPFCGDRKGKGDASIEKDIYHCYKCSESGYLFEMYAKVAGVTNAEAKKYLEKKYDNGADIEGYAIAKKAAAKHYEPNIAADAQLNSVYTEYLSMLRLDPVHRANLIKRGLSDEFIRANGYKSVPVIGSSYYPRALEARGYSLKGVTGFYRKGDAWRTKSALSGFYVPTRNLNGEICSMQIRTDYNENRYITFSSSGMPSGADLRSAMHFVGVPSDGEVHGIYLTEGALKADVAHCLSGKPFCSIPGVGNFRALRKGLEEMRSSARFANTQIVLATDMDDEENPFVKKNVEKIKEILLEYKFPAQQLRWDPKYKGVDDFFLSLR